MSSLWWTTDDNKQREQILMDATLKIIKLNQNGIGLAEHEGNMVEVPYTLPGEVVEADVFRNKDNSYYGRLQKIIEAHSDRVAPECQHFSTCGGCLLQHIDLKTYETFKKKTVVDALKAQGVPWDKVEDVMILGPGIRRRVDFHAKKYPDELVMGFHRRKSKRLINLEECKIVEPAIEALFDPLRQLMHEIMEVKQSIHFFITQATNGLDILMAGFKDAPSTEHQKLLEKFAVEQNLTRLQIKIKKKTITVHETAKPVVRFGRYNVPISPNAFLQASHKADQVLADLMIQELPKSMMRVADLFCGRGTLTLPLVEHADFVDGFECDKRSVETLKKQGIQGLKAYFRNLFSEPLTSDELNQYDCIVMDPPRCGAEAQVKTLSQSQVSTIIYVSCDPHSFARDAGILGQGGYELTKVTPVDQFMWSAHTEVVGIFRRSQFFD